MPEISPSDNTSGKRIYTKEEVKRARIVATMLSFASFITIIAIVYGFIQKSVSDQLRDENAKLKSSLDICQHSK